VRECDWDKPTPNWDDMGYPGRGGGRDGMEACGDEAAG
jgi:hypothetical protein